MLAILESKSQTGKVHKPFFSCPHRFRILDSVFLWCAKSDFIKGLVFPEWNAEDGHTSAHSAELAL